MNIQHYRTGDLHDVLESDITATHLLVILLPGFLNHAQEVVKPHYNILFASNTIPSKFVSKCSKLTATILRQPACMPLPHQEPANNQRPMT
jgi:hypothetical protein